MSTYYKPSGRFAFSSIIYLLIFSILVIPLLSYTYAYAIYNIPFIYINFLITIVFGALTGLIILAVLTLGKVRNKTVAILFAIIISTIAIYLHWASWVHLVANTLNIDLPNIVSDKDTINRYLNNFSVSFFPLELFKTIEVIIENGLWTIGSKSINGIGYWIIVIIEAGIIYFIGFTVSFSQYKDPFCEISNKWMKEHKLPKFQLIKNNGKVLDSIQSENFDFISELALNKDKNKSYSLITFYDSEYSCYMKVENYIKKTNSDSNDFDNHVVIDNILVEKEFMIGVIKRLKEEVTDKLITKKKNIVETYNESKKDEDSEIIKEEKITHRTIIPIQKDSSVSRKFKPSYLYFTLGLAAVVIIVIAINNFSFFSTIKPNSSEIVQNKGYENRIKGLLEAEEQRNFEEIISFYSPNIKKYWNINNPTNDDLKIQYERSWKITSNTKNYIKNIEKINNNVYDLSTKFEYFHKKKNIIKSVDSKVRFIFDNEGKIIEVYGVEE